MVSNKTNEVLQPSHFDPMCPSIQEQIKELPITVQFPLCKHGSREHGVSENKNVKYCNT